MILQIDPEYKALIPPLAPEEYAQLAANIIKDGCRDPLVAWGDIVIDGHNRHAICQAHGLPFNVVTIEFADRSHAKEWIIRNQFGRRNLLPYVRVTLALELESTIAARAKENQIAGGGDQKSGLTTLSNPIETINTRSEIAKTAGVSEGTIAKVKKINAKASDETKDKLAKGEISVHKAYQQTKEEDEPPCLVVDGTKEKPTKINITERNGMSIYASAKHVMMRLNPADEEFDQSLDAMIDYCQNRKQTQK
jgi:hypothetical protein